MRLMFWTGLAIFLLDQVIPRVGRAEADYDLVIADGEVPVALAGVMGGADSEVSSATTRVAPSPSMRVTAHRRWRPSVEPDQRGALA